MKKELEAYQLVERSIQTKFRKGLWNPLYREKHFQKHPYGLS